MTTELTFAWLAHLPGVAAADLVSLFDGAMEADRRAERLDTAANVARIAARTEWQLAETILNVRVSERWTANEIAAAKAAAGASL